MLASPFMAVMVKSAAARPNSHYNQNAPHQDFAELAADVAAATSIDDSKVSLAVKDTHAVLTVPAGITADVRASLGEIRPTVRIMSVGGAIEIYKEVGLPRSVAERFSVSQMRGTHGIGHTRMATESAVTTMGAHPFLREPINASCIMAHYPITTVCGAN